ncbi:MAG: class I SAM-dependent methyltransferase [Elusimicrobiota bacterium]|jgi:SAM-dependent methyltransferase
MPDRASTWDASYKRRENFVFWPGDELVRFVSRRLRRRCGLERFKDIAPGAAGSRVLDIGCGIGRNLAFGTEMGFAMYGMDLSPVAVAASRRWLGRLIGPSAARRRVAVGSVQRIPWPDRFFDHAFCDSVLDSMPFSVARRGALEAARVLRPGGWLYCSLISGDETGRRTGFAGEVTVRGTHERGTVQSYFNRAKIDRLLGGRFELVQCLLCRSEDHLAGTHHGRWHVAAKVL